MLLVCGEVHAGDILVKRKGILDFVLGSLLPPYKRGFAITINGKWSFGSLLLLVCVYLWLLIYKASSVQKVHFLQGELMDLIWVVKEIIFSPHNLMSITIGGEVCMEGRGLRMKRESGEKLQKDQAAHTFFEVRAKGTM